MAGLFDLYNQASQKKRKFSVSYEYAGENRFSPFKKAKLEIEGTSHEDARNRFDKIIMERKWRKPVNIKVENYTWNW